MANTFFSIIVPVYNRSKLVGETLDSILEQSFEEFEVLVVDDESTDDSLEVLRDYAKRDNRVKVIALSENQGRCAARNAGIKAAKGNWICHLDSDDFYYNNHLQTFYDLIQEFPSQKAFASEQTWDKKSKEYNKEKLKQDLVELSIEDFIESNPISANQLCYHNSLKMLWSEENIPISEDWLFHKLLSLKSTILKKNILTTDVRIHDERSLDTTSLDNFIYWNRYAAGKFIEFNSEDKDKVNDRVWSYITLLSANIYLTNGYKWKGFKLLLQSLLSLHTYKNALLYKGILKLFIPKRI
jgi:glycosyltransferase involved in cell wall biosynthesis